MQRNIKGINQPSEHKISTGRQFVNSSGHGENSEDIDVEFSEDKKKFAANMFGSDFDIDLISETDKEETMGIL